jgi:hypothetical protein
MTCSKKKAMTDLYLINFGDDSTYFLIISRVYIVVWGVFFMVEVDVMRSKNTNTQ